MKYHALFVNFEKKTQQNFKLLSVKPFTGVHVNSLSTGSFCMLFLRLLFFFEINISKKTFRDIIRVSNSLDPDQTRHFFRPDLGLNCLQCLSADNTINLGKERTGACVDNIKQTSL